MAMRYRGGRSYRGPSIKAVRNAAAQGARRAMGVGRRGANLLTKKTMGLPNWVLAIAAFFGYKYWDKIKSMFQK